MLVYTTTTGQSPIDPEGFATPPPWDESEWDPHGLCVHSVGYCGADWED